jgi:hypothetical protein
MMAKPNYNITREVVPSLMPKGQVITFKLSADDGQFRRYSYVLGENENAEDIANLENEIKKLLASRLSDTKDIK